MIHKFKKLLQIVRSRRFSIEDHLGAENINLGCGNKPLPKFKNADFYNTHHADIILDLNKALPFSDSSIDLLYSDNVFEHIGDILSLTKECYRVLKPGGELIIKVPYFKSKHAFVDPTHLKFFTIQTMDYFVKGTYFNEMYRFFDESFSTRKIFLDPESVSLFKKLIESIAIAKPNFFENSIFSNIFVFHNIVFVLKK